MRKKSNKFKKALATTLACFCAILGAISLTSKIPDLVKYNGVYISTTAASLIMPDGAKSALRDGFTEEKEASRPTEAESKPSGEDIKVQQNQNKSNAQIIETHRDIDGVIPEAIPTAQMNEGEASYPINERQIGADGIKFENFSLKNSAGVDIDVAEEMQRRPDVNISDTLEPQVLIYHTHTTESYIDEDTGNYPASFYPRSTDNEHNVTAVGDNIAKQLQANGISVVHDTTIHDNPSYNGSYYRSEDTIKALLEKYPSIQVTLDIHRDSMGNDQTGRTKPTFIGPDGQKAAQIMVISGCNKPGTNIFPDWEYNLRFALKLQQSAETMYPGITRPLKFCDSQYNLYVTHGSVLVEVGSDVNTLDEAKRSGTYVGDALAKTLDNLKT